MDEIFVKKLHPAAILPERATPGSAGYDLHACIDEPVTIPAGQTVSFPTGIAIAMPGERLAAFVFSRSGLGIRHGIAPANAVGVIDSDYRGEIRVGLHNHSAEDYTVQPGERIAQLLFLTVAHPAWHEADELPDTARGAGGFGSTGR